MKWLKQIFKSQTKIWVARAPRVRIVPLHHLTFTLDNNTPVLVNDISLGGIGLQNDDAISRLKVGEKIKARLAIKDTAVTVGLQVAFVANRIGFKFLHTPPELNTIILEYLRFEIAAIRLTKVDGQHVLKDANGEATWFVDDDNNELYFTKKDGRINGFHLTVLGNYVEWSDNQPRRFGTVLRTGDRKPYKMSDLINYSNEPAELSDLLDRLFTNVPQLNPDEKQQLLAALK